MKISALHIARLCLEMQPDLTGAEILDLKKDEVRKTVTIHFAKNTQKFCLVFHFGMSASYLYYLDYIPHKIITTNFLPQLRGCAVVDIAQPVFDRILHFSLKGDESAYGLVFELFGHSSNLYLLGKNNSVITTLRKAKQDVKKYIPPESPGGINPLDFKPGRAVDYLLQNPDMDIQSVFTALDDQFFTDLYNQMGIATDAKIGDIDEKKIVDLLDELHSRCSDFVKPDSKFYFNSEKQLISLFEKQGWESSNSLSRLLSEFSQQEKQPVKKISEKKQALDQVKRLLKRDSRKVEKLRLELERAGNYRLFRRKAEILSANLYRVKTGMGSVELPDYESGEDATVRVELSRSLSPGRNVERLFAKAKKLEDKLPAVRKEIRETEEKLNRLQKLKIN